MALVSFIPWCLPSRPCPGPGDGIANMIGTVMALGCIGGSGFAVFSLMGNGKKIEGCVIASKTHKNTPRLSLSHTHP